MNIKTVFEQKGNPPNRGLKLIVKIVTMYLDFGLNNLTLDC